MPGLLCAPQRAAYAVDIGPVPPPPRRSIIAACEAMSLTPSMSARFAGVSCDLPMSTFPCL